MCVQNGCFVLVIGRSVLVGIASHFAACSSPVGLQKVGESFGLAGVKYCRMVKPLWFIARLVICVWHREVLLFRMSVSAVLLFVFLREKPKSFPLFPNDYLFLFRNSIITISLS